MPDNTQLMRRFFALAVALTLPFTAQASELSDRVSGYINALNAGDVNAMFAFYEDGVTEDFRKRRSAEEDRNLYDMLTSDLGHLEIKRIMRNSDDKVTLVAHSKSKDMPVSFVFGIRNERIDTLSIRPGSGPPGQPGIAVKLPQAASDAEFAASLDGQLQSLADEDKFSGTVLLARNGKTIMYRAYGLADRETNRVNSVSTAFDIGSITKVITRAAVAQLLQAGALELDGRIIDYLPDYPNKDVAAKVTIQHLLDHRSGLGDIFNERWGDAPKDRFIDPQDFFPLFVDEPLKFEPGSGNAYSNAGFVVLGAIVEAVSGESFSDYLETQIFEPAGMTYSGLELRDGKNTALAIGYTPQGPNGALVDNLDMLPVKGCPAGSSMHTADDLLKLDQALRSGKLLDADWTAWMFQTKTVLDDASYSIAFAGGGPGVSAGLESNGDLTVVVLSNFDPPGGEALARDLFDALLVSD